MTKYLLADRERNYSGDSDFYAVYWDTETQSIRSSEYGTTRFSSPHVAPAEYLREIPDDIRKQAREFYADRLFEMLRDSDRRSVDAPENASIGDSVITLAAGKFLDKRSSSKVEYAAGEIGCVIWIGAFGKFYRNGYNHPCRSNRRVGVRFEDGRVAFMGLSNCKLARSYKSDDELMNESNYYARQEEYQSLFSMGMIQL